MGVSSDNNPYGIKPGIIFSFPVKVDPATKQWAIVPGLKFNQFAQARIDATANELFEEKAEAESATANA